MARCAASKLKRRRSSASRSLPMTSTFLPATSAADLERQLQLRPTSQCRPSRVIRDRPLSGESIDPGRNASFGRPDQRPSTRLEDRAESTSTTWVWRPRSCMSALVSDVRRGSGGEADPGRAPCGQRCVVVVMACMAGRVRTQTAELNRRSQGMRCSCIHDRRARRRMKRQSGAVPAKAAVEPMAWLRVARPPLAGGAAHRTSPPRGGPLNGRSPARPRTPSAARRLCQQCSKTLTTPRGGLAVLAAHEGLPAIVHGFGKQRIQALAQGWRHRARSKQAEGRPPVGRWVPQFAQRGQLGEHWVGRWAHPVPRLSGAPAVTTSRAALLRAHPRCDTSSTLPAYKGLCFVRCAYHP
jgi:hypothetical protein